ncbi:hypothetical protein FCI23_37730 [Actinacidiphila oryziradicis]|uniref:Sialidase domain-containing protein n=1 Tax=Actinacidiphila oryziradicis TaxID=2571141 RepID=A0A4U0S4I1_9ACTN|nr:hypothetical protein FCI23_37730 [Actinacidiphila oryziradicis]
MEKHGRLWIRVSRDSGKTWGPKLTVSTGDPLPVRDDGVVYPPCECPRCRPEREAERRTAARILGRRSSMCRGAPGCW